MVSEQAIALFEAIAYFFVMALIGWQEVIESKKISMWRLVSKELCLRSHILTIHLLKQ